MPFDPSRHNDPEGLRSYMSRAKEQDPAGYAKAFRRLCELEGRTTVDVVDDEMDACIAALEQIYFERDGKRTRASRIRRKRDKDGARVTLAYLVLQRQPTEGFRTLVRNGLPEFTAEYVVAKHATSFAEDVVAAARARLSEFAISGP